MGGGEWETQIHLSHDASPEHSPPWAQDACTSGERTSERGVGGGGPGVKGWGRGRSGVREWVRVRVGEWVTVRVGEWGSEWGRGKKLGRGCRDRNPEGKDEG